MTRRSGLLTLRCLKRALVVREERIEDTRRATPRVPREVDRYVPMPLLHLPHLHGIHGVARDGAQEPVGIFPDHRPGDLERSGDRFGTRCLDANHEVGLTDVVCRIELWVRPADDATERHRGHRMLELLGPIEVHSIGLELHHVRVLEAIEVHLELARLRWLQGAIDDLLPRTRAEVLHPVLPFSITLRKLVESGEHLMRRVPLDVERTKLEAILLLLSVAPSRDDALRVVDRHRKPGTRLMVDACGATSENREREARKDFP